MLMIWTGLIMPNGRSIVLERQPDADTAGHAALEDEVDKHWLELFKAATLSTLPAVGTELGFSGNDSNIIRALGQGIRPVSTWYDRNLRIQPTLTIRPGFLVRVIVNRDLVLEPYRDEKG
jgi:type IV secretion system protein VirB10